MTDHSNINLEELFQNAQEDPTLFSKINVEELLNALEKTNTDYLENKTIATINQEIYDTIKKTN